MKKSKFIVYIYFISALTYISISSYIPTFAKPSFARTQTEWEHLRDNKLEYDEIEALVEEYNPTVKANEYDYIQFQKKYGNSNTNLRQIYRNAAQDILDSIQEPDLQDASYVSTIIQNAQAKVQAQNLLNSADTSMEDSIIKNINNESVTKTIAWNAKNNMIDYYNKDIELQKAKLRKELAENDLKAKKIKLKLGNVSKLDILNAEADFTKAKQDIVDIQAEKEKKLKSLQVMLGWKYDQNPKLGALPDIDFEMIQNCDKNKDLQKAIESNYILKSNKRKLENATTQEEKDRLSKLIEASKSDIAIVVNNFYQNLISAKINYDKSYSNIELQNKSFEKISASNKLGLVSDYDLKESMINKELARLDFENAKNILLSSALGYNSVISGLANIGDNKE